MFFYKMLVNDSVNVFIADTEELLHLFAILKEMSADFQNVWDLYILPNTSVEDATAVFVEDKLKLVCGKKQLIVFGSSGCGKSTLINGLLALETQPDGVVATDDEERLTNDQTDDSHNLDDNEEKEVADTQVEDPRTKKNENITTTQFSKPNRSVEGDVNIIEANGIEVSTEDDIFIQKESLTTDLFLLIVSSVSGFNDTETTFLMTHKELFSICKILVVFNSWDKVNKLKRKAFKAKSCEIVREYLVNEIGITTKEEGEGVFFLSAKELTKMQSEKSRSSRSDLEQKNESWDEFFSCLNECLRMSFERRQMDLQQKTRTMVNMTFDSIRKYIFEIRNRIKRRIENTLNKLTRLNDRINEEVCSVFDSHYELLFQLGKKAVKLDRLKDKPKVTKDHFTTFLEEYLCVIVETLKQRLRGILECDYADEADYAKKILEAIYFPFYFDSLKKVNEAEVTMMRMNYTEIVHIISKYKVITVVGSTFGGATIMAACGVAAGVAAPLAAFIALPTFVGTGYVIGGGFGGLVSHMANKVKIIKRLAYSPRYKSEEENLKIWWNSIKKKLIDSYQSFLSSLPRRQRPIMSTLIETLRTSKKTMDGYNKRWIYLKEGNESFKREDSIENDVDQT